jgi:hypothetical protein
MAGLFVIFCCTNNFLVVEKLLFFLPIHMHAIIRDGFYSKQRKDDEGNEV